MKFGATITTDTAETTGYEKADIDVREVNQSLQESEERFRIATNSAAIGTWSYDISKGKVYASDQYKQLFGLSPEKEMTYELFINAVVEEDRARTDKINKDVIELRNGRTDYECIYRVRGIEDGKLRWLKARGKVYADENGKARRFTGAVIDITKEKEAEETLNYRKALLEAQSNAIPDGLLLVDRDGKILSYNDRFAQIWQIPKEILAAKDGQATLSFAITQVAFPEAFLNRVQYLLEHSQESPREEILLIDGRVLERYGRAIIGEDGYSFGWAWYFRDITEHKRADDALQQSNERFQAAVAAVKGIVWTNNENGEMHGEQPGWAALTGQRYEEYQGFGWSKAVHPDDAQATIDAWNEAVRDCKTFVFEHRLRLKDGSWGQFSVRAVPVTNQDNTIREWVGVHTDITEQRRAEQTVKESEAQLRLLAESMPQIVWSTDANGHNDYYNKRWYEYTGLSLEETMANGWLTVLHPDDVSRARATWRHSRLTGDSYEIEYRMKNASGQYRWLLSRATPYRNEKGELVRWFGTCTDIHDQKMMTDRLEELVEERTKELQMSNDDLQQFAHVASHDLKEPVRKIRTFASRLQADKASQLSEIGRLFLDKIEAAAQRMYEMIDGVLTFSSISATQVEPQVVDLNVIMEQVESDLEVIVHQKGATMTYANLPAIQGTPVLIHQLFYNLVNNSLKFSRAGVPPQIAVTASIEMQNKKRFARISVKDNGIGFDQTHAHRIFESFSRLNSKDKFEGTGLGLSLCKKIAERHGGTIQAFGSPHQGAEIVLLLPVG